MTLSADALETVDLLYRAAIDAILWPDALEKFALSVGCIGMAMIPITPSNTTGLVVSMAMDEVQTDYQKGWYRHDSRVGRIFSRRLTGGVVCEPQLFTAEEVARDPFRQEFCRKWGIGVFAAQLVEPWPGQVVAFSVQRGIARGQFEGYEIETLNWLGPHAARALTISQRLKAGNAVADGLLGIIDRFDGGVVVLNGRREVTHINARAEAMIGDGLSITRGRVFASASERQPALDRMIASAFEPPADLSRTQPLTLPRPSGARPLLVQALPLGKREETDPAYTMSFVSSGALLLIVDPQGVTQGPEESLRLLGLTAAEARLAALVGSGMRRRDAAAVLRISALTASDSLKRIYSKLDIASVGELVRLVDRIGAVEPRRGAR